MKVDHYLRISPDSEAEEYFVKEIMPLCKDKVAVMLGATIGIECNTYMVSHDDYLRVQEHLKKMRGY